jgi:hypothetical protein
MHSQYVTLHVPVLAETLTALVAAVGLRSSVHSEVISQRTRFVENVATPSVLTLEKMSFSHCFEVAFGYNFVPCVWYSFEVFCKLGCLFYCICLRYDSCSDEVRRGWYRFILRWLNVTVSTFVGMDSVWNECFNRGRSKRRQQ